MQLDEHLPAVWIDEDLIKQVIMNVLVNAQHAIEGEGSHHHQEPGWTMSTKHVPNPVHETVPMVEISDH